MYHTWKVLLLIAFLITHLSLPPPIPIIFVSRSINIRVKGVMNALNVLTFEERPSLKMICDQFETIRNKKKGDVEAFPWVAEPSPSPPHDLSPPLPPGLPQPPPPRFIPLHLAPPPPPLVSSLPSSAAAAIYTTSGTENEIRTYNVIPYILLLLLPRMHSSMYSTTPPVVKM